MGVIFSDIFIVESFRKFTEGERKDAPDALPALIYFWQEANENQEKYKKALTVLKSNTKIADYINNTRKKNLELNKIQQRELYAKAYDDLEASLGAKIKESHADELENIIRVELTNEIFETLQRAGLSDIKYSITQVKDICARMLVEMAKQRDEAKNETRELHNKLDAQNNIQALSNLNFKLFQTKSANANLRSLAIASVPIGMGIYFHDPSLLWMIAAGETCCLGSLGVYKGTLYNRGRTIYEEISRHVSVHPELGNKYDASRPAKTPGIGLLNRLRHLRR